MLAHVFRRVSLRAPFAFSSTAYRDTVDYYQVLEVEGSATEETIRKAYAELTNGLKPEVDSGKFKRLNEAFVILTDSKTRDAYDSLLGVRKSYYLSPEEERNVTKKSYLASRKAAK
jgi:DnaJ-class molecular chaperone